MKTKLFFLLLACIVYVSVYGQTNHIITDNADGASSAFAADFNGDTFMDVVAASRIDNTIAWYENTDGSGTNWAEHIITTNAERVWSVQAADFDGDTDMDVVAASGDDDTIAWWENDGSGNFTYHEITSTADVASCVFAVDINGDTFMDVVAAYMGDNTVAWWENDGVGNFTEHIITTNALGANVVYAADLNNDGYPDVLSASIDDGKVVWYKNMDGLGDFTTQPVIVTDPDGAWVVSAADFNGDGFMDVIAAIGDSTTAWYENTDGSGTNWVEHIITTNSAAADLCPYDIDMDGDIDIISAEFFADELAYFENDGSGNFVINSLISVSGWTGPHSVHVADINGDSDQDIISTWWGSDHVAWHEWIIGVDEYTLSDFSVYPIPTTGILNIQSKTAIVQIQIYNLFGQLVKSSTNHPPDGRAGNTIDISRVSQGIYFIKVMDENGNYGTQKVIKK